MAREFKGRSVKCYVKDYTVLDLETTSCFVSDTEIVEISAIKVRDGVVIDTFDTLVNPGCHIPAAATAVTVTGAYAATCYVIFNHIFELDEEASLFRTDNKFLNDDTSYEWFLSSRRHDDFTTSFDGLSLHAIRIENHPESNKWVILGHPYKSSALNMKKLAYKFDKKGYNVLIPDERACGLSKGKYTGLGWTEHYDLINWINLLIHMHPEAEIVLYGISTGANAIMNASGDFMPKNVKCGIVDSGYVSQDTIISKYIEQKTNVKGDLFLFGINFYVKQILHFSLADASPVHQLENAHFPILFMQAKNDEFIPQSETYNAFYACSSDKDLYFYEKDAANANYMNEEYFDKIFTFIESK